MLARAALGIALACLALAGCDKLLPKKAKAPLDVISYELDPYPSTYKPLPSVTTAIINAHILDGIGGEIPSGTVVLMDGKVTAVGADVKPPEGATIIDAKGRWVTPGIVDIHSHLGVYPSPGVDALQDGNEISSPDTAEVWAEHGIWPQDPGFDTALAGGVTTLEILPGSANLFGGRGVIVRNVPSRTVQNMKFPGAPYTLKMACGENPKRVYGYGKSSGEGPGGAPYSRMGEMAGYRAAWQKAREYKRSWENYAKKRQAGEDVDPPTRDLQLDTLKGVLDGKILVEMHCYRADEMAQILDMAKEFGYHVAAFHHAVEAYKIADLLKANDTCAAMWADWWGFKMEAYDAVRENIPLVHAAGACAMIHSDSEIGVQRLNQEIAKALGDGRRAGLDISKAEAWRWVSSNPAKALGILDQTGSLEPGKRADVVLWSGDPYSTYTLADQVFIDGALLYDRSDPARQPKSDFMLGQAALAGGAR
jgi:imidazolonepropionase-like amidohydrolase